MSEITEEAWQKDLDLIRYMVGAMGNIPKRQWGYRNRFRLSENDKEYGMLKRLEALGYVARTLRLPMDWGGFTFYATLEGCHAIGLKPAQIKRAMEP